MHLKRHPAAREGSVKRVEVDGRRATVVFDGDMDMQTVPGLQRSLDSCIESGCDEITVDLSGVSFMDSSGVATLALAANSVYPSGAVIVRNASAGVKRILQLTAMDKVLRVEPA